MSTPSIFPVAPFLIDCFDCREIVLPHYVYSGVLQVSFPPPPLGFHFSGGVMGTGRVSFRSSGFLTSFREIDAQVEKLP